MDGAKDMSKEFDDIVNDTLKLWRVPGISVAIVDGQTTTTKVRKLEVKRCEDAC
jgi:hypothetical protein